jgi:endoglucanase
MNAQERRNLFQTLTAAFGPSGCEEEISKTIEELARPYADEIHRDSMGNLIVHKKGQGKKLLFSAHMDSVGVMITQITDQGYLKFSQIGGLVASDLSRTQVRFANGTQGVISVPEDKEEKSFSLSDLYIDIGAASKEESEKLVGLGDCAVFTSTFFTQNGKVFANYLDNRAGCLALLEALSQVKGNNDLYFLFSAQEEVGLRGAKIAAFGVEPDYGIGVDVTCTDDLPGAAHTSTCKLGGGTAIKVMDHSVLCTPQVYEGLRKLAQEKNIPAQMDVMVFGGTDAGAIMTTKSGVKTGGISIPCRYTHAPIECMAEADYEASVALIVALAESELE